MADLTVIVPSRGRPGAAVALARVFGDTCQADTTLLFAVDESDPEKDEYGNATRVLPSTHQVRVEVIFCPSRTMVQALNYAAVDVCTATEGFPAPFAVGFLGDDHCPRTFGWDSAYVETLRELGTGLVYGNDLLQGERIPTQVAMTADIVRALGYMAPPILTHLFVDNYWKDLGTGAECLWYLPDVVVEHRHPVAGKAQWDAGYVRVNDTAMYDRDGRAYAAFADELAADVAQVRALRGAA